MHPSSLESFGQLVYPCGHAPLLVSFVTQKSLVLLSLQLSSHLLTFFQQYSFHFFLHLLAHTSHCRRHTCL
uniref:Putative ovule protein n=1 Tax=Solanum chacoense TaxID=4108 RepID=A0A0V0H4F7_SOLCH